MQLDRFPLQPIGPNASNPNAPGYQYGYRITSYFGGRVDPITGRPGTHGGEDLGAVLMTPMIAVVPGWLTQFWDSGGGGNWSSLTADNGVMFGYGHAHHFAGNGASRRVQAGEIIAYVDSTGSSTGNHLHFAYRPAGVSAYADPYDLLQEVAVRQLGGGGGSTIPPIPEDDMFDQAARTQLDDIAKAVHVAGGLGIGDVLGTWENDTRSIIINGVHMITAASDAELSDKVTIAGWASRPYAFCYDKHPAVFQWIDTPGGQGRQWIEDQADLADLVRTKLNPAIQVFPAERQVVHDARFPVVGKQPPA